MECQLRSGTDQRTRSADVGSVGHGHEDSGADFTHFFIFLAFRWWLWPARER